ncbi:MAG: CdaR family protein [Chloroflexota bacterium]
MRRVADFLRRNWPLRVGAIVLATLLYTGLVLGQNVRTWNGQLPVDPIRPPQGATLLSDLAPVTKVRFRAPLDVGVLSPDSFRATVDLSRVDAVLGGDPVQVPVTVVALDSRVQIVDFEPQQVEVRLDPVAVRELPVTVTLGSVAEGLSVGPEQVEPSTITLRGASSRVAQVSQVVARVSIDASALNVDREIELVAVDGNGNQVTNIEIDPERARVRIAVARELANVTLPVVPMLSGEPAPGYRISAVSVEPLVVTVSGEEGTVTRLESAPTQPIDIEGRTTDLEANIGLDLPAGISVNGSDQVTVMLTIEQEIGTRSFFAAVTLVGTDPALLYEVDVSQIQANAEGPVSVLADIDPASVIATVDVTGLGVGTHALQWSISEIEGVEFSTRADLRRVVISAAPANPSAAP